MANASGKKRPAAFLDRDGTIIEHVELIHKIEDVHLLPGAAQGIKQLNERGYFTVIVTNQPAIARGVCSEEDIQRLNDDVVERLAKQSARIDAVYYCPHHPEANVEKYRIKCDCRKPEIGMMTAAEKEHNLDMEKSWMVGDTTRDIQAGNRAKLKTILVKTGQGGNDVWQLESKADFVVDDLLAAAKVIAEHTK